MMLNPEMAMARLRSDRLRIAPQSTPPLLPRRTLRIIVGNALVVVIRTGEAFPRCEPTEWIYGDTLRCCQPQVALSQTVDITWLVTCACQAHWSYYASNSLSQVAQLDSIELMASHKWFDVLPVTRWKLIVFRRRIHRGPSAQSSACYALVTCDRRPQLTYNMIGNAVKFTKAGSVLMSVSVQAQAAATNTLLTDVTDTGPRVLLDMTIPQ